ncbi:hypothetical protein AB6A40_008295 [Gnathostoma spinigerum]|uniref:Transthyretin-like family protein n=1 Tax=Gnathostoma spinigerum TaxID=75299 RepID=A0ABD6EQK8_9BILA
MLLLAFIITAIFIKAESFRYQSVKVIGQLNCGGKPASNIRVKLWDKDSGPDPDDLLDQSYTDSEGRFELTGVEMEFLMIDPVLKVYHDCNKGVLPGKRKVSFAIPPKYVTQGKVARRTFNVGSLNLETIFPVSIPFQCKVIVQVVPI